MKLAGSMVALVTPMTDSGEVDHPTLEKLVDWHVSQGTHALVVVGTTGESATLEEAERQAVFDTALKAASGRLPIIAGTGANGTDKTIALTRAAAQAGVQACLLVTPYYNKPQQEGLYQHFKAVAQAVDIPQILYNVPGRTACDLLPETVARLSQLPTIVGIKEATGDLDRLSAIKAATSDDFLLFSGDDATSVDFMLQGGHGTISVTANVAPALMAKICDYALAGQAAEAREANEPLQLLHRRLFIESNPIPVKWALHAMRKIPSGAMRLPLTPLMEGHYSSLTEALEVIGALSS